MLPFSLLCMLTLTEGFLLFSDGFKEVCYNSDGIGCFNNSIPFNNAHARLPASPADIQTGFLLYTRANKNSPQHLRNHASSIQHSHFSAAKKTKFIIHGFQDSGHGPRVTKMAHEILTKEDVNVFNVDWSKGADIINYIQAAANTRVVGALTSQFITTLHTSAHVQYGDIHLIGHSLGAHVAGYVGERIHGLGRITGLDPAGPLFENYDMKVRLDSSDARFVDIIHTDGDPLPELGFGLVKPIGHADFYPNGGEKQPGCDKDIGRHTLHLLNGTIDPDLKDTVVCSHMRAVDLFTASVNAHCRFRSFPCASLVDYKAGRCNSCGHGCAYMGYDADQGHPHGTFYLTTTATAPFCQH